MRIAVLSDTHDAFPSRLPSLLKGADEIWHLGDVVGPGVLEAFGQLGAPLRVVMGNCDSFPDWPLSLTLERKGLNFHLVHIPPSTVPLGIHVVLHGHTHIPRDTTDALGVRWLNPGAISHPRGGFPASFAWLELGEKRVDRWSLVRV